MRVIYLKDKTPHVLGTRGDHAAACIRVNVDAWLAEYPSGHGGLIFTSPEQETYPLDATTNLYDGVHYLEAVITSTETQDAGWCVIRAAWYDGETMVYSRPYYGKIMENEVVGAEEEGTMLDWVATLIQELADAKEAIQNVDRALEAEGNAEQSALNAEAWAVGERDGEDVDEDDPTYGNNARKYAQDAGGSAAAAGVYKLEAEAWAKGTKNGTAVGSTDPAYQKNAKYYAEQAFSGTPEGYAVLVGDVGDLKSAFQNHEMVITPFVNNSYLDRDGNITNYTGWKRTDYLNIEKAESIAVVSSRQSAYNCFFDSNKNFISPFTVGTTVTNISVPYGAVYVMFSNTNAGMDALVVKENTMSDAKIQVALDSATKQFNANNLDFVQGIYSSTGVINSSYTKAVNADIPSNSIYITNQYDGYYYFAVWDSGGTYVGAFYFSGFAASGSSGVYYENIANIKPIFEQYPDATVKIVYIARNADDVLINTENFNTLFSLYVQDAESGSGIDPEVLVENTITGVYNSVDIDNKIAEYGALLADSGKADTFLFFTDPHPFYTASTSGTLSDGWKDGINRKMPIIGKAYHSTGTAFCLCGGDWLGNTDTPAVACTKLGYVNGIMKNMFDRFYMLNGNHDVNEQGTEVLTDSALINTMFSREGKAYQAFKAANAKFYLFDTGAVFPSTMSSYRWEQIDWFAESLLADDDANNVIGLHIVTNQYKDSFESDPVFQTFATNIMTMAEAYNAKATITMNEKTYDFTGTTGKVRFAIAGHSHFDAITTLHNIPIMITNWVRAGSVSTFDLVLADYDNGVVKTVRIGSGSNRTMTMA